MRMKREKNYNILQNSIFMIVTAWKKRCSLLWLCMGTVMVTILLSMAQLFVMPAILNAIESGQSVGRIIAVTVSFGGALVVLSGINSWFSSCMIFKRVEVRLHIAAMIQNKILTMSFPDTENQAVRKKMDKAMMLVSSNTEASEVIWNTFAGLLKNGAEFVICFSIFATLNPLLLITVITTSLVSFWISNYINGWGYRHRDEEAEYSRRMNYLSERSRDYTLAKDVRIFGMGDWIEGVYENTMQLIRDFSMRKEKVYLLGDLANVIFTLFKNGIVYLFLIAAVLQGEMNAAQFLLYFNAAGVFANGIGGILSGLTALSRQSLDISAIREFLEYPESFLFDGGIPLAPDSSTACRIELKNVSFRYSENHADILSHINLTIHKGEKLAVVGLNGAGKTTLIKLICGFLDPTEGEVLFNGINVKSYNRRDYYRLFSAVFQDFSLLDATIAENIAQADQDIDPERIKDCIKQAGLEEKISKLHNGLYTHLGKVFQDGIELSGGELQRLMLARALYKNAPVIILDEPTAALDPIAESRIYRKYDELMKGRTSIYISHRLASTRFCDRIILLSDQRIAEEGTHEELMAKNGQYAKLFRVQSRYYQKGGVEDV